MDDEALLKELQTILTNRVEGNPYGSDGSFAENLASLPPGLRAMAATHWLDISLTLDSITWHFGNFGEPHLVAQTEAGLRELGLEELADCFHEASEMMLPLLEQMDANEGPDELLERKGVRERADEINQRAWDLDSPGRGKSVIYEAWIKYARKHPERILGTE